MYIYYFGKPYSFTHIAALHRYGENHNYISKPTITETIGSVMFSNNSIAIVPIENSTGGIIYDTVDVLIMDKYLSNIKIIEELELKIRLFLLTKSPIKLSQVKKVYSHEYALKKSEKWISECLPVNVTVIQTTSTSEAAHKIMDEKFACAIASEEAAKHYKLKNLAEINDDGKRNITKFFVLEKNDKKN